MRKLNKQGNLNMIVPAVLILILAAVILLFSLLMQDELLLTTADTQNATINESVAAPGITGIYLYCAQRCGAHGYSVTQVINKSTLTPVITAANYSVARDGLFKMTGEDLVYSNGTFNVSYTCLYSEGEACSAINSTIGGTGRFADYFDLIVLAIVISVIISLLLVIFSMRKTQ